MKAYPINAAPRRISPRWLFAVAAIVVFGFVFICGSVLLSMRRGDADLAQQGLVISPPPSMPISTAISKSTIYRCVPSPAAW
jgi:hypothetical protein